MIFLTEVVDVTVDLPRLNGFANTVEAFRSLIDMAFKSDGVLDAIFSFDYCLMLLVQTDADMASSVALFALHVLSREFDTPYPFP